MITEETKDLSPEEAKAGLAGEGPDVVDEDSDEDEDDEPEIAGVDGPEEEANAQPDWAIIPKGVKPPRKGKSIAFMRFPAEWTTDPSKGDRWCACWEIGETEERLAYGRARGDMHRSMSELAKATIRVVDGHKADWSGVGKAGSVSEFWTGIGAKGRQMIRNYYVRTHTVSTREQDAFFSQHFALVTVG